MGTECIEDFLSWLIAAFVFPRSGEFLDHTSSSNFQEMPWVMVLVIKLGSWVNEVKLAVVHNLLRHNNLAVLPPCKKQRLCSFWLYFSYWYVKVKSAAWALDRGVCVVICNGMQDNAIKMILRGRRIGTFCTESGSSRGKATTDVLAENGKLREKKIL
jgi:hypothetical protein